MFTEDDFNAEAFDAADDLRDPLHECLTRLMVEFYDALPVAIDERKAKDEARSRASEFVQQHLMAIADKVSAPRPPNVTPRQVLNYALRWNMTVWMMLCGAIVSYTAGVAGIAV